MASGLPDLIVLAGKTSFSLYKLIKSYPKHTKAIRELTQVLEALHSVLDTLAETIKSATDVDLSALKFPLERCTEACTEFEKEIQKFSSRSSGDRTSFRDWAKLQYMGDDVNGFRQLLEGYKTTIGLALTLANLRKTSQTADSLESHKISLKEATNDLEAHLQCVDEKLETIIRRIVPDTDEDITELRRIKEERLSTEKCLEICAQLSSHIDQIQSTLNQDARPPDSSEPSALPKRLVNDGVRGCKDSIDLASEKLQRNLQDTMDRLIRKSKTTMTSKEDIAELSRMWSEWEAASKCKEFFSKAENYLNENISIIENRSAGNSDQYMVSTDSTVIHGINQDDGGGAFQCGGHIDSATLQAIVRSRQVANVSLLKNESLSFEGNIHRAHVDAVNKGGFSKFNDRYGRGIKLSLDPAIVTLDPSIPKEGSTHSGSPKARE